MSLPLASLALALVPQDSKAFTSEHERFALDLLRSVSKAPGNVLLSPYSVAGAFAMAREGAAGDTAAEIDAVLHFPAGSALDALAQLAQQIAPRPAGSAKLPLYELGVANSVWAQKGYELLPGFVERMGRGAGARFFEVDFLRNAEQARGRINAWVADNTKDRIPELIPAGSPTPDTRMILANAVYLKARWAMPFEADRTHPRAFQAPSGEMRVPMMNQTATFSFVGESERARVLALQYFGGLEMLIVLPKEVDGIAAVLANESFADWTAKLAAQQLQLALPKFEFDNSYDLVPVLASMGLRAAFDPALADFSGISPRAKDPGAPLYIGAVRHKSWIAVDELGTEAAAATSLELRVGSAARPEAAPTPFIVDHPFLFFVRHKASGLTLFAGRVDNPRR